MCRGNSSKKHCEKRSQLFEEGSLTDNGVTVVGHAGGSQVAISEIVSLYETLKFFKNFKNAEILEV